MANISKMQGTPFHIEVLKSEGERRHPSYCIYAEGKGKNRICTSPLCPLYSQPCRSAAKCDHYEKK